MNYYYDIILNWSENEVYEFYEWNDTDCLEYIKKIPLFKIKHKVFLDFLCNKIKVDQEFLDSIYEKTMISEKNVKKLDYACLFTDGKNTIAFEFNSKGEVISRSKLLIDDELNILEVAFTLKETSLSYEILGNLPHSSTLRQEKEAKYLVRLEINQLYENKEIDKLKYYYYEYKKEQLEDLEQIYHTLMKELDSSFNQNILKLYYIIKLSYHNV